MGSIAGQGTKIRHATQHGQKQNRKTQTNKNINQCLIGYQVLLREFPLSIQLPQSSLDLKDYPLHFRDKEIEAQSTNVTLTPITVLGLNPGLFAPHTGFSPAAHPSSLLLWLNMFIILEGESRFVCFPSGRLAKLGVSSWRLKNVCSQWEGENGKHDQIPSNSPFLSHMLELGKQLLC